MQARIIRWGLGSLLSRKYDRYVTCESTHTLQSSSDSKKRIHNWKAEKNTHTHNGDNKKLAGFVPFCCSGSQDHPFSVGNVVLLGCRVSFEAPDGRKGC